MFSTNIEHEYYSPIRYLQKKFLNNYGSTLKGSGDKYFTTSFIVTSLTSKIFKLLNERG